MTEYCTNLMIWLMIIILMTEYFTNLLMIIFHAAARARDLFRASLCPCCNARVLVLPHPSNRVQAHQGHKGPRGGG